MNEPHGKRASDHVDIEQGEAVTQTEGAQSQAGPKPVPGDGIYIDPTAARRLADIMLRTCDEQEAAGRKAGINMEDYRLGVQTCANILRAVAEECSDV